MGKTLITFRLFFEDVILNTDVLCIHFWILRFPSIGQRNAINFQLVTRYPRCSKILQRKALLSRFVSKYILGYFFGSFLSYFLTGHVWLCTQSCSATLAVSLKNSFTARLLMNIFDKQICTLWIVMVFLASIQKVLFWSNMWKNVTFQKKKLCINRIFDFTYFRMN